MPAPSKLISIVGILSVAAATATLQAQTRPSEQGGYQQRQQQPQERRPYNNSPYSTPDFQQYNTFRDYPAEEVRAIPTARAQAAVARAMYRQAHARLNRMIAETKRDFEGSEEFVAAIEAEDAAYEALLSARDNALRDVRKDPNYLAAVKLANNLSEQIDRERDDTPAAIPVHIVSMATVKMTHVMTASAMEEAALDSDDRVRSAKERFREAAAQVSELRREFQNDVRFNPELVAAREQLAQARIGRLAADAFLRSAVNARDIALNYAYYLNRYRPQPFQYAGYGYPYGYGYGGYGGYRY